MLHGVQQLYFIITQSGAVCTGNRRSSFYQIPSYMHTKEGAGDFHP